MSANERRQKSTLSATVVLSQWSERDAQALCDSVIDSDRDARDVTAQHVADCVFEQMRAEELAWVILRAQELLDKAWSQRKEVRQSIHDDNLIDQDITDRIFAEREAQRACDYEKDPL